MVKLFRKIKYKIHKFLLNIKYEKLQVMALNIVDTNSDVEPLLKEGMWYSDIAEILGDLKDHGYIVQIGEDIDDMILKLTQKGHRKLNGN